MSTINSKNVQVGTSGTASQNFTLYQPATPDGTVRLGVGNSGATTLDAVTVTSAGNVTVSGSLAATTLSGAVTGGAVTATSLAVSGATTTSSLTVNNNAISAVNSLEFRNRILNGGMVIDQRNVGASISFPSGDGAYCLDRWRLQRQGAGTMTVQRVTSTLAGFANALRFTVTGASTPSASDYYTFGQIIEGFNTADLAWGTASAQSVTLSFWINSSVTGTYSASLFNWGGTGVNTYPATFTVNAANTWEYKTITIPGSTAGTWATTNAGSIYLRIDLGSGSNYNGTANAWNTSGGFRTSGSVNFISNASATLNITGVQFEVGSVATPFERRDYGRELIMCQRYFEKSFDANTAPAHNTGPFLIVPNGGSAGCGGNTYTTMFYKVSKRSSSTIRIYDPNGTAAPTTNAFRSFTACNSGSQSTSYFPDGQTTEFFAGTYQAATSGSIAFLWTADSEI